MVKGADTATGSGAAKAMSLRQGDANGEFVNLAFETGAGGPLAVISAKADATGVYPNTTGSLTFNTQVGGGVFERLRIHSNGDISIGDNHTSATQRVDILNGSDEDNIVIIRGANQYFLRILRKSQISLINSISDSIIFFMNTFENILKNL